MHHGGGWVTAQRGCDIHWGGQSRGDISPGGGDLWLGWWWLWVGRATKVCSNTTSRLLTRVSARWFLVGTNTTARMLLQQGFCYYFFFQFRVRLFSTEVTRKTSLQTWYLGFKVFPVILVPRQTGIERFVIQETDHVLINPKEMWLWCLIQVNAWSSIKSCCFLTNAFSTLPGFLSMESCTCHHRCAGPTGGPLASPGKGVSPAWGDCIIWSSDGITWRWGAHSAFTLTKRT